MHRSDYSDREARLLANLADEAVLQAFAGLDVTSW
jgi:hypothetical protein